MCISIPRGLICFKTYVCSMWPWPLTYSCPALLIISLEIFRTRIIHLHAHSQVVYCNCVVSSVLVHWSMSCISLSYLYFLFIVVYRWVHLTRPGYLQINQMLFFHVDVCVKVITKYKIRDDYLPKLFSSC